MISICIASYNGEKYIEEQLRSILLQIDINDEIIISDDGSSDGTLEIVKEFQKKYKNIFLVEGPHLGVIKNFENALLKAKGDIIFLCDQDDVWYENKVSTIVKGFQNKNIYLILHDANIIDENGKIIKDSFFLHRKSTKGLLKNIYRNSYLGCCMAFRKDILNKILPFPKYIEMHDWWIGLIVEKYWATSLEGSKLIGYRRHSNNVSSFKHHPLNKMIFNRLYMILELIRR